MPDPKPVSPSFAFYNRMKRDGRENEYKTRVQVHTEAGVKKNLIAAMVRNEMDPRPDAEEIQLHQQWQAERDAAAEAERQRKLAKANAAKGTASNADSTQGDPSSGSTSDRGPTDAEKKFLSSLKNNVKYRDEVRWVRNHPKMLERVQSTDGRHKVYSITLADIKSPMHGPAPSKHAVMLLKLHVQDPVKFFEKTHKEMLDWDSEEEDENEAAEMMDDLSKVQEMIREATKTTRVKAAK